MNQIDKTKNKKIIGMAVAALAVLAAVIIGIVASKGNEGAKLQKLLDTGAKYLAELDYEQAVAVYNEAIALDPKSVDAYLGLAEAYLGMGDTEAAIAALEAGYEATGDQTIGDRLAELVEETQWLTLQYDFRPEDITLMGYNLFADHYQEISAAMEASRTWDEWSGNGNYSLETEDRWYSFQDDGETLHYQVNSISHPEPNAIYSETIWYVVYQNSDPNRQKADFRNIWTPHGYGEGMEDAVNAPIRNHQTFEEVCELLQVATIREKAKGMANNTAERGQYYFKSNLGNCHYYENFHGSNQEEAEALVGTCIFAIYYETGYTFEIRFAVRRDGLVESCQYSYYLEEDGYPDHWWNSEFWEAFEELPENEETVIATEPVAEAQEVEVSLQDFLESPTISGIPWQEVTVEDICGLYGLSEENGYYYDNIAAYMEGEEDTEKYVSAFVDDSYATERRYISFDTRMESGVNYVELCFVQDADGNMMLGQMDSGFSTMNSIYGASQEELNWLEAHCGYLQDRNALTMEDILLLWNMGNADPEMLEAAKNFSSYEASYMTEYGETDFLLEQETGSLFANTFSRMTVTFNNEDSPYQKVIVAVGYDATQGNIPIDVNVHVTMRGIL